MPREPAGSNSGRPPTPHRLVYLLTLASRRVQHGAGAPDLGITSAQAGALFLIGAPEGVLIGDVARALGVGPAGMSGLADRMVRAGLVRRVPDGVDGRAVRLELTKEGWAARDAAKDRAAALNAQLADGFSDAELDIVARWLSAVAERFNKGIEK